MEDIWATDLQVSKHIYEFKQFSKKAMPKVKAVMTPEPGQSFNPSAKDHFGVLKQVIDEEVKDIEKDLIGDMKQQAFEQRVQKDYKSESEHEDELEGEKSEESDSDESGEEHTNKPVDRLKKLTRTERNKKVSLI